MANVSFSSAAGPSTPAHGTVISTDELEAGVSSRHAQHVKLLSAAAGSTVPISTTAPLPVVLIGSSVTISGNSTAILSTNSVVQVEPKSGATFAVTTSTTTAVQVEPKAGSTFGISGNSTVTVNNSTAAPVPVQVVGIVTPYAPVADSTYANLTLTSSANSSAWSSAGSTRFNITALSIINGGATAAVVAVYDGSTTTPLFRAYCASAGGGVSLPFPQPLSGAAGNNILVNQDVASTVYVHLSGFRSA